MASLVLSVSVREGSISTSTSSDSTTRSQSLVPISSVESGKIRRSNTSQLCATQRALSSIAICFRRLFNAALCAVPVAHATVRHASAE
jgi:hypothetical protein